MEYYSKRIIQELTVDFYEVDAGWIYFKLTLGDQVFETRFSEVFDPILDFKHWLEALAIGVQQTSFSFDIEGADIKFDFERVTWEWEEFSVSDFYADKREDFINATVSRRQIVYAFYRGLLDFPSSDTFISKEWEIELIKERLCKLLKIDEITLVENILVLDKNNMDELLFRANPSYWMSVQKNKQKKETDAKVFADIVQNIDLEEDQSLKETRVEYPIPNDHDCWSNDKKTEYIKQRIEEPIEGYHGTKISNFRSKIIEDYLDNTVI